MILPLNTVGYPTCSWLEVWVSLCSRKSMGSTQLGEYFGHERTAVSTYVWRTNLIWLRVVTLFMVPCVRLRNVQCSTHYRQHLLFTPRSGPSVGSALRSCSPCCICSKSVAKGWWLCLVPPAHSKRLLLEFFNHETVMACGRFLSQNLKGRTQPLFGQIQSMIIFTDLKDIAL